MSLNSYINFSGNAKEVMTYYQGIFQAPDPYIMYFKDMPPSEDYPITAEMENMVMHGHLIIDDAAIMFSDIPPGSPQELLVGNNITLMYSSKDYARLESIFNAFAKEGQVSMPFTSTFWSKGYGYVVDKFGIHWQLNCDDEPTE